MRQRELLYKESQDHLSQKMAEYDALKRGYDELHYESETLRRTINTKSEEISGLNQIINQQLPDEEKNERADFSIKNTDNKLLLPQVIALHEQLLRKAETNE